MTKAILLQFVGEGHDWKWDDKDYVQCRNCETALQWANGDGWYEPTSIGDFKKSCAEVKMESALR